MEYIGVFMVSHVSGVPDDCSINICCLMWARKHLGVSLSISYLYFDPGELRRACILLQK